MPQSQRAARSQFNISRSNPLYGNTTPFPNYLLNEVMPTLKDTEWRLLCVIVRQTLGWHDQETGGRKNHDWLTRTQLMHRTGRNSEALSRALDSLILQNLIEVKSASGKSLTTTRLRREVRGRIFYALHPLLIQRLGGLEKPAEEVDRPVDNVTKSEHESLKSELTGSVFRHGGLKSEHRKVVKANGTKETLTKQTETKDSENLKSSFLSMGTNGIGEGIQEERLFEMRNLPPLAPAMQSFIATYQQGYIRHFSHEPPAVFCSALVRLHIVQREYSAAEMNRLLGIFFACELAHIKAQRYSLEAFVHNIDLLQEMNS